jgi:hypothetical protein
MPPAAATRTRTEVELLDWAVIAVQAFRLEGYKFAVFQIRASESDSQRLFIPGNLPGPAAKGVDSLIFDRQA